MKNLLCFVLMCCCFNHAFAQIKIPDRFSVITIANVDLFEHCQYGGRTVNIGEGRYAAMPSGISSDMLSSLKLASGTVVYLFDKPNFGGRFQDIKNNIPCLADFNFNDRVSSMLVTTRNDRKTQMITPNAITEAMCPSTLIAGDREFGGNGPLIKCEVTLRIGDGGRALYADIYFHAKETKHNWSETSGRWSKKVYDAPSGKRITEIISDKRSYTSFNSPPGNAQFLFPGNDVAANVRSIVSAIGIQVATDVANVVTSWIDHGNNCVQVPPTDGSNLVKAFKIVGDTGGDDISTDNNCNDDTRIVGIEFNPILVVIE